MLRPPYCQYGSEDADWKADHGMGLAMERRRWQAAAYTIIRNAILESRPEDGGSTEYKEEVLRRVSRVKARS